MYCCPYPIIHQYFFVYAKLPCFIIYRIQTCYNRAQHSKSFMKILLFFKSFFNVCDMKLSELIVFFC